MHIAMWSGPRNLSTAMMYSFGARADFQVLDEPFYGAYLSLTGADHPMRDQILSSMECNPARVSQQMQQKPQNRLYSKQMTHHMVDGIPRDWFAEVKHAFLIRHPARVVASYEKKRESPELPDIGFVQQVEIFNQIVDMGLKPVVVDSFDIRKAPQQSLKRLCAALEIPWDPMMLSWPKGGHPADGIWAQHWYGAVHASTGFGGPEGPLPDMTRLAEQAMPYYEKLAQYKI